MNNEQLLEKIIQLRKDLDALNQEFYKNNFSAQQDFNKKSNFTTRLKIPHYAVAPSTAEVGELIEVGGKLYICSVANTFVVAGTQS
jgi:hypothetical protein